MSLLYHSGLWAEENEDWELRTRWRYFHQFSEYACGVGAWGQTEGDGKGIPAQRPFQIGKGDAQRPPFATESAGLCGGNEGFFCRACFARIIPFGGRKIRPIRERRIPS